MEELLELLKDGKSRSLEMLANELNQPIENVKRSIQFLEQMRIIKKVDLNIAAGGCTGCTGCNGNKESDSQVACAGCMPEGGFKNMGTIWEINERK